MELKNCPFCGKTPPVVKLFTSEEVTGQEGMLVVCCDYCSDGCGATAGLHADAEEAVQAWNNRS